MIKWLNYYMFTSVANDSWMNKCVFFIFFVVFFFQVWLLLLLLLLLQRWLWCNCNSCCGVVGDVSESAKVWLEMLKLVMRPPWFACWILWRRMMATHSTEQSSDGASNRWSMQTSGLNDGTCLSHPPSRPCSSALLRMMQIRQRLSSSMWSWSLRCFRSCCGHLSSSSNQKMLGLWLFLILWFYLIWFDSHRI